MTKSATEASRIKRLTTTAAREARRRGAPGLDPDGMAWLEQHPQSLWPLLDAAVAACTAGKRDDALVGACMWLLANQLELIRYRLERGHQWASELLDEYQLKLMALLEADVLQGEDWFGLVRVLQIAKVPVRPEMAEAMGQAMAAASHIDAEDDEAAPGDLSEQLRELLNVLATSADDPFQVVQGLAESGALMPAEIRVFLTHELALSPHDVLRESVPLLLLDADPGVRKAAAASLEQAAGQAAFSPLMLRRTLLIRNWVPEPEREAIDRLIRKARLKGVACAQWEPAPVLEIRASTLDGSGAQGVMLTTPGRSGGLFAGLLLKQGFGLRDAWCDLAASRRDINRALKDTQREMAWCVVDRDFLDATVQHHIACGLAAGNLPQAVVVQIAEATGAADWKDRRLDVVAETQSLLAGFDAHSLSADAIATSLQRSGDLLAHDPALDSWFEDDATTRALVAQRPRPKPAVLLQRMLDDVLPQRRDSWAEKSLLLALWLRNGRADLTPVKWQDFVVLAHELISGRPMAELPAMIAIAQRSLFAARTGGP